MIISKTPFRMSFFGGGTDFPEYFRKGRGAVLGTAIDKYIYHSITRLPSELFDYSLRLAYRKVECVTSVDQIEHPAFREVLRHFNLVRDLEIGLTADLPALSGIGSSSSFTVGLIHALSAYEGKAPGKAELARLAIFLEREKMRETVGWQDQILAAFGGFNLVEFGPDESFRVTEINLSASRLEELEKSLMMFFTRITRKASEIERRKINNMAANENRLAKMLRFVDEGFDLLTGNRPLSGMGELLDGSWKEKRTLDSCVSAPEIDKIYSDAMEAGALGGKLLGAGGGGFFVFYVPPERQQRVRDALKMYPEIPFGVGAPGSAIIHSSPP